MSGGRGNHGGGAHGGAHVSAHGGAAVAPGGHDPHLGHHYASLAQQTDAAKLGMWLFLVTEILLFGGLFVAYAVYRSHHPEVFAYAHRFLDKTLGGLNTVVLICSSLTMAWAVRAAQLGNRRQLARLLTATLLLAAVFLGVKAVEYEAKWKHGLLWGKRYQPVEHTADQAHSDSANRGSVGIGSHADMAGEAAAGTASAADHADARRPPEATALPAPGQAPAGLAAAPAVGLLNPAHDPGDAPRNVHLFFGIYFVMTGLHGIHVIAGMIVIGWLLRRALRGEFADGYHTPVDLGGLYWHLVDLVWIYLFPLLYLIH